MPKKVYVEPSSMISALDQILANLRQPVKMDNRVTLKTTTKVQAKGHQPSDQLEKDQSDYSNGLSDKDQPMASNVQMDN